MLGHIMGSGKHRPDPDKTAVLQELERPRTKAELRRLLGMFGYYGFDRKGGSGGYSLE